MKIKTNIVIKSKGEEGIESIQSVKTQGYHICGLIHKRSHGDRILRHSPDRPQSARVIIEILFLRDVAETTNDKQILPSNKFD